MLQATSKGNMSAITWREQVICRCVDDFGLVLDQHPYSLINIVLVD
jgi:hypothetical protein